MSSLLTTVGLNKVSLIKPAATALAVSKLPLNTGLKLNNVSLNQRCLLSNKTSLLEESKCQNGACTTKKRLTKKKTPFDPSKTDYSNCEGFVHSVESMGSLEVQEIVSYYLLLVVQLDVFIVKIQILGKIRMVIK